MASVSKFDNYGGSELVWCSECRADPNMPCLSDQSLVRNFNVRGCALRNTPLNYPHRARVLSFLEQKK